MNELLIGGTRHGTYAPIPETHNEWMLFTEADREHTNSILASPLSLPEPELYYRSDLRAEIDGVPLRRSLFRHSSIAYDQALAALTDLLLKAWIKGQVSPGG
jgi:hypothetical protein